MGSLVSSTVPSPSKPTTAPVEQSILIVHHNTNLDTALNSNLTN